MVDRSGRDGAEQQSALLVDDSGIALAAYGRRLESRGFRVTRTSDPDLALGIARQTRPRAIFLTIALAGTGRTPLLVALRRDDQTRHIPVTLLQLAHDDPLERMGLSRVGRELW